jgi:hypothetical protein
MKLRPHEWFDPIRKNSAASGFASASALLAIFLICTLSSCKPQPRPPGIHQQLLEIAASPIPGARASVPPAAGAAPAGPMAAYCVTDVGFCPLAAETEAGRNCLCETATASFGGTTGAAPKPYSAGAP